MAWDCAIPPDTRGDVLVQWCLDNGCVIHNAGECTPHTTRHGPSAPDVTISRECRLESWTAPFSPDSDHCIILFELAVGDDNDEPLRFLALVPPFMHGRKRNDLALDKCQTHSATNALKRK
ncbi:Tbingi protein [Trypanosoma theileri]|uniref:Tbingi protein n=1 Tax=Trypanosoma theileri TaxID=67003 RepID=A0A1X0NLW3_9TRYP|nr:Tbingi protein [Trypanosoma theileri]ORC85705.1 Tbingi protein [Trypanosoma theileri]